MNNNYNNKYHGNTYYNPIISATNTTNGRYDVTFDPTTQVLTGNSSVQGIGAAESQMAVPETVESTLFVPGFMQSQIGKLMRVEFLVGNVIQDRVGVLRQVGASYILLQPVGESTMIMCDLFSIRFATIINRPIDGETVVVT